MVIDLLLIGLVRFFQGILRVLPERADEAIGAFFGGIAYRLFRGRRAVAEANLARVFPDRPPEWRRAVARRCFRNLGVNFIELLLFPYIRPDEFRKRFALRNHEALGAVLNEPKKGVLGLVFHYANWEIMGVITRFLDKEIVVLARPLKHNRLLNEYLNSLRSATGLRIIPNADTARDVMRFLREGKVVAILADQREKRSRGIPVEFFGEKVSTNKGIVAIAMKTGAPVIPVYLERKGFLRYEAVLSQPIEMERAGDLGELIYRNTRKINAFLESLILNRPEEWFWVHRRWGRER